MAKAYPREFRDDVVAVARKGQSPSKQMAKDFGISEGCLHGWMKRADSEDGNRPGVTAADQLELREARERIRLLEQENEVLRRAAAYLSQVNLPGKQSSRSSVRWLRPAPQSGCRSRWRAGFWADQPRGTTKWLRTPVSRGVSAAAIHNWVRQDQIDRGERPGITTPESIEPANAKKRIRQLEEEVAILKKASKLFGEDRPPIEHELRFDKTPIPD